MNWKEEYKQKLCSAQEAVQAVRSGDRVFWGVLSSGALVLLDALCARADTLSDVTLVGGMTSRRLGCFDGAARGRFHYITHFMGSEERRGAALGLVDYTCLHLSQIAIYTNEIARPNVLLLDVSLPDENGYMSYSTLGVCFNQLMVDRAETIILQVNPKSPYVCGQENRIHVSQADCLVEVDMELPSIESLPPTETLQTISRLIVEEVPDGATIQLGLGGVADAVGFGLSEKNDLGVHSEMFTNSMMRLAKRGVITNRKKTFFPDKFLVSFAFGSRELYDFLDHNALFHFAPFPFVNNPFHIAQNDRMVSVNTAIAIDLTGQVAADSIGFHQYSSTGGQVDFVRGAQAARNGKSFIAITSTADHKQKGRISKIVPALPLGTAVTTPRSDVQYVATEYGCVNLKYLPMSQRVRAMISLAHPDFRDELTEQAMQNGLIR